MGTIDARLRQVEGEQDGQASSEPTAASIGEENSDKTQTVVELTRPTGMNANDQTSSRSRYLVVLAAAGVLIAAMFGGILALTRTDPVVIDPTDDVVPDTSPDQAQPTTTIQSTSSAVVTVPQGQGGSFVTPSGNISGVLSEAGGVSCIVFEHDWTIDVPTESGCEFDWGDEVGLGPEGVTFGCYSDVFWDTEAESAGYGTAVTVGDYTCSIAETGVTCENENGNGFSVSRSSLDQF